MSGGARAGRRRGQPLAVLGVVLAGWVGLRVVLWEPVLAVDIGMSEIASTGAPTTSLATIAPPALTPAAKVPANPTPLVLSLSKHRSLLSDRAPRIPKKNSPSTGSGRAGFGGEAGAPFQFPQPREPMIPPRLAAGHQLMMLAALGQLPLPPLIAASQGWPTALPAPRRVSGEASRWSGDGWVLLRRGSDGLSAAPSASPAFGRYGASQAGAVLRYSLAPASPLRPQAHLRLTRALGGARGQGGASEAAAGFSGRPLAGVPLRLYGEGRVQRVGGVTRLRPAASPGALPH